MLVFLLTQTEISQLCEIFFFTQIYYFLLNYPKNLYFISITKNGNTFSIYFTNNNST